MLRITTREIILVTLIVAMRLAWCVDHRNIAERVHAQCARRDRLYDEFVRLTGCNAFFEPARPQRIEWIGPDADWWPSGPPPRLPRGFLVD